MSAGGRTVVLDGTFDHWRAHARALVAEGVAPDRVRWRDAVRSPRQGGGGLFAGLEEPTPAPPAGPPLRLPKALVRELSTAACFRDEGVWSVLHRIVHRVAHGERDLVDDPLDADVVALGRMTKAVGRDAHKMHAFVRFRRVADPAARGGERFVAWYRPSHLIAEREAGFFRARFPSMDWSILTPDRSVHWDGEALTFTAGAPREQAPDHDELEELWCTYYASIFNPARVKTKAMVAEMPRRFWDTLPETRQIPALLADVPRRLEEMAATSRARADSAAPFVPFGAPLDELEGALAACEGCALHRDGTRPVFGEGPADAAVVLLGEQPGDGEERAGRPFVGPAGRVLDDALRAAGLARADLYLTNTVKHFHHRAELNPRGKRRLHARPTVEHVSRCQPWLDAELAVLRPRAMVCLGRTAARAVFGPTFRMPPAEEAPVVRSSRYAEATFVTFHPAAILRAGDGVRAEALREHLVAALIGARLEGTR